MIEIFFVLLGLCAWLLVFTLSWGIDVFVWIFVSAGCFFQHLPSCSYASRPWTWLGDMITWTTGNPELTAPILLDWVMAFKAFVVLLVLAVVVGVVEERRERRETEAAKRVHQD